MVGIDTGHHGRDVMAEGFPDRMGVEGKTAAPTLMLCTKPTAWVRRTARASTPTRPTSAASRRKLSDAGVPTKLLEVDRRTSSAKLTDEDIINFMMIPLCLETVRCLEDGIVETAAEADMGLIYGIGFPPFRGGALRYIDSIGVAEFVALADKYAELGALYTPDRQAS